MTTKLDKCRDNLIQALRASGLHARWGEAQFQRVARELETVLTDLDPDLEEEPADEGAPNV